MAVPLKVFHQGFLRRFCVNEGDDELASFCGLVNRINRHFHFASNSIPIIQYEDDDSEWVECECDSEWREALRIFRQANGRFNHQTAVAWKALRLRISDVTVPRHSNNDNGGIFEEEKEEEAEESVDDTLRAIDEKISRALEASTGANEEGSASSSLSPPNSTESILVNEDLAADSDDSVIIHHDAVNNKKEPVEGAVDLFTNSNAGASLADVFQSCLLMDTPAVAQLVTSPAAPSTALLVPGPSAAPAGTSLFDKLNAANSNKLNSNTHNSLNFIKHHNNKKKKNGASRKRNNLPILQLDDLTAASGFWQSSDHDDEDDDEWTTVSANTNANRKRNRNINTTTSTTTTTTTSSNSTASNRHVSFADTLATVIPPAPAVPAAAAAAAAAAVSDEAVETIVALGFDRDLARFLLEEANGNLDEALEVLLAKN